MTLKAKGLKSFCLKAPYLLIALLAIYIFWTSIEVYAQSNYDNGATFNVARAKLPEGADVNTDRPAQDYKNFDLKAPNPELCKSACEKDPKCKAYTYVKPGAPSSVQVRLDVSRL